MRIFVKFKNFGKFVNINDTLLILFSSKSFKGLDNKLIKFLFFFFVFLFWINFAESFKINIPTVVFVIKFIRLSWDSEFTKCIDNFEERGCIGRTSFCLIKSGFCGFSIFLISIWHWRIYKYNVCMSLFVRFEKILIIKNRSKME